MKNILTYKQFVAAQEAAKQAQLPPEETNPRQESVLFELQSPANFLGEKPTKQMPPLKLDDFKTVLANLIPAEVIGTYIFIEGLIHSFPNDVNTGHPPNSVGIINWVAFGILFIINPFYNYKIGGVTNRYQLVISTIGFAVWVLAIGGPFETLVDEKKFPIHLLGAVILALYTLIIPIFMMPKRP